MSATAITSRDSAPSDGPEEATRAQAPGTGPFTLAVDIGGTGLKASVLDAMGAAAVERVRVPTTYPMPPAKMVADLRALVGPLPAFDRISVGFPGMVRKGRILSAPHFVTAEGPGSAIVTDLVSAWQGFDLAAALTEALGQEARVVNDADLQGAAVVAGHGLELVITLGTGFGTAIYVDGHLAPHLELSHHPFRNDRTYEEELGNAARKRLGYKTWNHRVQEAVATLDRLVFFDSRLRRRGQLPPRQGGSRAEGPAGRQQRRHPGRHPPLGAPDRLIVPGVALPSGPASRAVRAGGREPGDFSRRAVRPRQRPSMSFPGPNLGPGVTALANGKTTQAHVGASWPGPADGAGRTRPAGRQGRHAMRTTQ